MAERSFNQRWLRSRRLLSLMFLLVCLWSYCALSTLAQPPSASASEQQAQIAALIEQLGDENYHRRNDAEWQLERLGLAAFEQLREAAQVHPNAQVARAARYLSDSQNVVWWLESDSPEVRELLKDYNKAESAQREAALEQLSDIDSPDATLALCRLARFESSELRSKSAALYLMQAIAQRLKRLESQSQALEASQVAASLSLTLGDSQRTASTWLRALIADLIAIGESSDESHSDDAEKARGQLAEAGHLYPSGVATWKGIIEQEQPQATSAASATAATGRRQDPANLQSDLLTLRLYRWIGSWVTDRYGRAPALEMVRTSLDLVGQTQPSLVTSVSWAIDAELPELVPELSLRYSKQFSEDPELGYFLAEAYLRLGDEPAAQRSAETADQAVVKQLEQLKNLPSLDLEDIQANRHYQYAVQLSRRGLFAWSEQQYLRAVALESRIQAGIRTSLADFYWSGGEYDKAAQTLKKLAEDAMANRQTEYPVQADIYYNPAGVLANFHFYSGLAALERGQKFEAKTHLQRALEVDGVLPNPDVVIALQKLGSEEPFGESFQQAFDRMSSALRVRVLEAEALLAQPNDRSGRVDSAMTVAHESNQLAWLLSKCQISTVEAISLSLRSLELAPDQPAYLDTLARCYFAAGQINDAIRTQKRAIRLAPHERQMLAQLAEFEAALELDKE